MPSDFTTFRAQCGLFYYTFTSFMAKMTHMFRSQCRLVKLVPRLGYFPSPKGLYFYSDCALFGFFYVTYTYDESCIHRKARFGIVTAVCVSVFLARLLLMCMDVESNLGPGFRDTLPGKPTEQHAGGFGVHTPFHFGRSDGTLQNPSTGTTTDQYPFPQTPTQGHVPVGLPASTCTPTLPTPA